MSLQVLLHIPAFFYWLKLNSEDCCTTRDCVNCIINGMRVSTQQDQTSDIPCINPLVFYKNIARICEDFVPGLMQDAHEFFNKLVNSMDNTWLDLNGFSDELDDQIRQTSPIGQIFGGYMRDVLTCPNCKVESKSSPYFKVPNYF